MSRISALHGSHTDLASVNRLAIFDSVQTHDGNAGGQPNLRRPLVVRGVRDIVTGNRLVRCLETVAKDGGETGGTEARKEYAEAFEKLRK